MCSEHHNKDDFRRTSTVDTLDDPIPELFDIFTSEPDEQRRWSTYTYSAHFDLLGFTNQELDMEQLEISEEHRHRHEGRHHRVDIDTSSSAMNCTVAYMAQCMSLSKCKDSCNSIGASSYRWFHEYGCCECIGTTCLNYGNSQPMCLQCPPREEDEENELAVEIMYEKEMNPETGDIHAHNQHADFASDFGMG